MILLNPNKHDREYPDQRSREIMLKTIEFFEDKGRGKIKKDDHERNWYSDFLEFQKEQGLFAPLLTEGGIFAFGLSEKEHGADLYSTGMALTPLGDGKYAANGRKYYIGNANEAALVSTFGK